MDDVFFTVDRDDPHSPDHHYKSGHTPPRAFRRAVAITHIRLIPPGTRSIESTMSFLGIEGYHVFITGAAGGIGQEAVKEFLGERRSYRVTTNQC